MLNKTGITGMLSGVLSDIGGAGVDVEGAFSSVLKGEPSLEGCLLSKVVTGDPL